MIKANIYTIFAYYLKEIYIFRNLFLLILLG